MGKNGNTMKLVVKDDANTGTTLSSEDTKGNFQ